MACSPTGAPDEVGHIAYWPPGGGGGGGVWRTPPPWTMWTSGGGWLLGAMTPVGGACWR